jgi:hypothetical protein
LKNPPLLAKKSTHNRKQDDTWIPRRFFPTRRPTWSADFTQRAIARRDPGAVVLCDNTSRCAIPYADDLAFVRNSANGFHSLSLLMSGGLELSVRVS